MLNIPEIKIKVSFKKKIAPENLYRISCIQDAYKAFKEVFDADTINWKEEVILLCLNSANQLTGFYKVSSGGLTSSVVDPRVIYSIALHANSHKIIIAHNHPTGNLKPSEADLKMTQRLKEGGTNIGY